MYTILKKIVLRSPLMVRRFIVRSREWLWRSRAHAFGKSTSFRPTPPVKEKDADTRKNILIYALHGMRHAGTERNLQLIANSLVPSHNVFFAYGEEANFHARAHVLHPEVVLIPFAYTESEIKPPHLIHGMSPYLDEMIAKHAIDILVTATPGYSHYPWNLIIDIPIVLLNIFGAPTLQKNVVSVIYNSETTKRHAEAWIGQDPRGQVMYAPIFNSPPPSARALGEALRKRLSIPATDFIFGRIGRADDNIFDPIGIRAWKTIAERHPNAHYLIMSPPPALVEIVEQEHIPRVHFLPPSGREEDVWAFHGALNAFAHFRYDGETSGVAIAESLTLGNPVISHESHVWNAHLEYLSSACARIAKKDDHRAYGQYMEEFIHLHANNREAWEGLSTNAKMASERFDPTKYGLFIRGIIANIQ